MRFSFPVGIVLQPADFVQYAHKTPAKCREAVFHFDGGLLAVHRAIEDAESLHFAEPLVHDLCR